MKEKSTNKDLFVSDIAFEAGEEDLHKLFSVCGKVRSVHLITDPGSGLFKGCAFVNMSTAKEAREALNMLDGTRLLKRCISVSAARPKQPAGQPAAEPVEKKEKRPRRQRGRRSQSRS